MKQDYAILGISPGHNSPRLSRLHRLLVWLVLLSFAQPVVAVAQTSAPGPLTPTAQQALDKGVQAARQQEWKLAIRYLDEARKAAPGYPAVYYNLALAEGKLPGREWRAIAWFEAFLALLPEAENAAAVRSQISELELRGEANVARTVDMARDLANKSSDASSRATALGLVGTRLVESGDHSGAISLAGTFDLASYQGAEAMQGIAIALGKDGRYEDADRLISRLQEKDQQSWANYEISKLQSELGLLPEARARVGRIENKLRKSLALRKLALAEHKAGKKGPAAATLAEAQAITISEGEKSGWSDYLDIYLTLGDWAGAKALLHRLSDEDPDHRHQTIGRNEIAKKMNAAVAALVKADQLPAAEALADEIPGLLWQVQSYWYIAFASKKQNLPDKLTAMQTKIEGAYAQAPRALEVVLISGKLSQLAALRGDKSVATHWRLRALDKIGDAMKDPAVVWWDGTKVLGPNVRKTYEQWQWSDVRSELKENLTPAAVDAADEKSLRLIVEIVKKAMPAFQQPINKAVFAEAGLRSAIKLAQISGTTADIDQAVEVFRQYAQFMTTWGGGKELIVSLLRSFWNKGDFIGALRVINAASDPELKQRMLDKHHDREFYALSDAADWNGADRALNAISFKFNTSSDNLQVSDRKYLLRDLADAQKRNGDWNAAQKTLALIEGDSNWRAGLFDSLNYARIQIGDSKLETRLWIEQRSALPPVEKRAEWLSASRGLVMSAPNMAEARPISEGMLAEVMKEEKPLDRLRGMNSVAGASGRLGQFEIQRTAQLSGLNALQAVEAPDWSTTYALLKAGALTDYLGQPATRWRSGLTLEFARQLAANGNPTAAEKILPQLPVDLADSLRLALVESYCVQGNVPAARTMVGQIKKPSSNWDRAYRLLAKALIESGNHAEVKKMLGQAWPDQALASELTSLLIDVGDAELGYAQLDLYTSVVYRDSISARIMPAIAAKTNDWSKAAEQFRSNWYYKASFVEAVAKANNPELAQQLLLLPEYINFSSSDRDRVAVTIVAAIARQGGFKKAEDLATKIVRNDERFNARCAIAAEQAKSGDLAAARQTLQSARQQDPRTPPDLDVASWIGYMLTETLTAQPAFDKALKVATVIGDEYWRHRALRVLATTAAKKDVKVASLALVAIKDDLVRSEAAYAAIAECLRTGTPAQALTLLDSANDPGYQAMGLRLILNHGVAHGNAAEVLPRILGLRESAAKACLLNDLLKAQGMLSMDMGPVFAAAVHSARAMTSGVLQAYLLADLANRAPRLGATQTSILRRQAAEAVQSLTPEDALVWKQFGTNIAASKTLDEAAAALSTPVKDPIAEKAAEQVLAKKRGRARSWIYLAENSFGSPLHTDFKAHLDGLAASVPADSRDRSWALFHKVDSQITELLAGQKKIRSLRIEQAK